MTAIARGWRRSVKVRSLVLVALSMAMAATMVVLPSVPSASAGTWWSPPPTVNQPWQWELSNPLNLGNAKELGTDDKLPDGAAAPAPVIYDIDAIINPASTV
ncbi:MAG: hypothetical protein ABSG81_16560, partial [Acidimicrobiales bacterium]